MKTGPAEGAADPVKGAADEEPPTVLLGALKVKVPNGETLVLQTTFDTGSDTDAVSETVATRLKELGVSWGEAGGGVRMAVSSNVAIPHGQLRLMLVAEPRRGDSQAEAGELAIPRTLEFVTDALIMEDLSNELIIGWPTLKGTGLMAVVLGLEEYELEEDKDDDGLAELWDASEDPTYGPPTVKGTPEEVQRIQALCEEYKHLFGPPPHGGCKLPPIDIKLKKTAEGTDMEPRRLRPRYVSPWINELIRADTKMRIEKGWMRWPDSDEICPYASPIVAAKQPSKGPDARRICADYRHINECAEETRHPVKNPKEVMLRLKRKKRFATFDLRKGYHQCRLTKRAALLLAVATQDGLVIPITAPFGFHGLPAQFQFFISKEVLEELDGNGIESFIDDLNVNAMDFEELFELIKILFQRLDKWDLRINGAKSVINVPSCIYLGHEVDGEGKQHTAKRVQGIQNMQRPYDRHQVKAFMGGVNYLREHLGIDFAELTVPINNLLKKNANFEWTEQCQKSFEQIKERAAQMVKLHWLDYEDEIYIRCDASKLGCGAQLFQVGENGFEKTVSFISKTFTKAEQNWSTLEQELFAVVWSAKTWMSWLEGAHFTVQTDHKNILQLQKSNAPKVVRWRLAMQQFDYTVVHVEGAGAKHAIADCISRLHGPQKQATLSTAAMTTRAQSSAAKALLESTDVSKTGLNQSKTPVSKSKTPVSDPKPSFDVLKRELRPRNSSKNEFQDSKTPSLGPKTRFGDLKQQFSESKHAKTKFDKSKTLVSDPKTPVSEQGDKENTSWKGLAGGGTSEPNGSAEAAELMQVCHRTDPMGWIDSPRSKRSKKSTQSEDARNAEAKHISVHLDCSPCKKPSRKLKQPDGITPEIKKTLETYHNSVVGHMGTTRTYNRLARAVRSGKLKKEDCPTREQVNWFVKVCKYCQKLRLRPKELPVARHSLMTRAPMEEVSLDVIGPLCDDGEGNKHIIVMIDNFSHFTFAEPVKSTEAEVAAKFIHKIAGITGFPKAYRWDNCSQFENHLVRCLMETIGTESHPSIPFNPQTNGIVERNIAEVMRHLRFIVNERRIKTDWSLYLPMVLRILNSEKIAAIGLSPQEILMPGLDLDRFMYPEGREEETKRSISEIPEPQRRNVVRQWVNHLKALQVQAIKTASKYYDLVKARIQEDEPEETREFAIGDWVVVPWRGGKPDKFSVGLRGPFEVMRKQSSSLYEIRDPADDKLKLVATREMNRYHLGPDEDVRDTIAMDEFENLVEEVVDHRKIGNSTSVRDFDFRVRWTGLGPEEDTWHPYMEMTRKGGLKAFWDYVELHPELGIKRKF